MSEPSQTLSDQSRLGRAGRLGLIVGVALLAGAGVALWASEGASIFVENAFAAVIACF